MSKKRRSGFLLAILCLQKGVQEIANEDGTVPWKRILEFGTNVFLMDRTATDLKNKWRSMCKGSPGCK
ncbi:PHD finger 21B [Gossypium australe]|uniref:PHD finger 21B n=1 Tax=Gossypium australe TaxID=47621 RepID=A0A5B6UBB7_9ROSI|nr:PHD finger 21B [Gossypium australe]